MSNFKAPFYGKKWCWLGGCCCVLLVLHYQKCTTGRASAERPVCRMSSSKI